ncbi:undecaprenyl-diphosphate phosphatase, partial [bacterium]|nr:undecaprenyl-diphosphate phosphatase [bacterium]
MHTLQAVITGAIQGLSEFLPISSSAHIVFSNTLYELISGNNLANTANAEEIFFDIMVHLATLIAVIIYFFKDLKLIIKDSVIAFREKKQNENSRIFCYIMFTTLITGIIGLILKYPVEKLMVNPKIICLLLMITGFVLLFSEKMYKGDKKITLKNSFFIALAQGLAIFPGFSRSGFTIASALLQGIDRITAARFSFLMSIPVILLASLVYPLIELDVSQIAAFNHRAIILGFLTSFFTGYLCIKYFMQLLKKITLKSFGYYCLFASLLMFLLFQVC